MRAGVKRRIADQISGGLADESELSEFDPQQLELGQSIEMEHTEEPEIATEIASDHLEEIPDYYTRLDEMEEEYEKTKAARTAKMRKNVKQRLLRLAAQFSNSVNIPQPELDQLLHAMNQVLADMIVLHWQVKTAHWNIKGSGFPGLHPLFDKIADSIAKHSDRFAERITALGGLTEGTVREAIELTGIEEYPKDLTNDVRHAEEIRNRLRTFVQRMRKVTDFASRLNELETENMLTEFSEGADKYAWFLDSTVTNTR